VSRCGAAIAGGIAKIIAPRSLRERLPVAEVVGCGGSAVADDPTFFAVTATIAEAFRERCLYYIDLFGAAGRA
jgi:hypothetical protein